ncbi:MAG TPA: MmcQ/YjbR family DNA-binding protein [Vicinamibacterales bacterium]|nr:MmcQ/YjbR family DNA-binding protein [Vicinamibacterales bacterium]
MTFTQIEALVKDLPRVERSTSFGAPALKVDGKMFACTPTHKSADPNSLAVRLDFPDRDAMIEDDPEVFYIREHYVDYACVLVRLDRIHKDALRDLLRAGYTYMAAQKPRVQRTRRKIR